MASTRYDYTGGVQSVTLQPGRWKLEAFGAGGGNDGSYAGGRGGYAKGELVLTTAKTLFLCIGGAGTSGTGAPGGYNGGGKSGFLGSSGSGGGATHIAMGSLNRGTLASYEAAKNEVVLVAGGGGGAGNTGGSTNGFGGGTSGGPNNAGKIATQTTGYSFGIGEDRVGIGGTIRTEQITGNADYISRHNGESYFTTVATLTITGPGNLEFGSTSVTANTRASDPYGYIYKNGILIASNDDGGTGYNFYMNISVAVGDIITLKIAGFSTSGSTPWYCNYPSSEPVDGGAGGGGWYGGYCSSADANGGGGSGYVNTSVLQNTGFAPGGGAAAASHGYIIITNVTFGIQLTFENCSGTPTFLRTDADTTSIVTCDGNKKMINQVMSKFEGYIFPDTNDLIFTAISPTQYRITLNVSTISFTQNKTYLIRALYVQGRLNSNYYKDVFKDYFDLSKILEGL